MKQLVKMTANRRDCTFEIADGFLPSGFLGDSLGKTGAKQVCAGGEPRPCAGFDDGAALRLSKLSRRQRKYGTTVHALHDWIVGHPAPRADAIPICIEGTEILIGQPANAATLAKPKEMVQGQTESIRTKSTTNCDRRLAAAKLARRLNRSLI